MFVWKRVMGHVIFSIYMLVLLMLVVFISHFYLSCYCTYIQISLRHWGLIWYVSYNESLNNVILCQKVRGITGVAEATPIFRDLFYIPYINHVTIKISGFLTNCPFGHLDFWHPSVHPAIWTSGHHLAIVIKTSDHPAIWPSERLAIRTSGHLDIWLSRHLAIQTSGHPDIQTSGHLAIRTSGHLAFYPRNVLIETFLS